MYDRQKNISQFLLNFKRSDQDRTFSIRIQDGTPMNNQRHKKEMPDRQKNLSGFLLNSMKSYQDLTFSTRIQDGSPRDNQRDKTRKCLADRKTVASFCWILCGLIRTSLFPPGSRMGAQGITKGTKKTMFDRPKNLSEFLLNFMRSHQDFTFSTRIQDGSPMESQRDKKENVWQAEEL